MPTRTLLLATALVAGLALAKDSKLTPERCIKTSYSYAGCVEEYPTEARQFLEKNCNPKNATVCAHLATMQVDGVGGPKDVAKGMEALNQLCTGGDRISCAHAAGYLAATDAKRALELYHRACDEVAKAPSGLCAGLKAKLKP